ncbi:MAG: SAM-dependent methyltransferase, partial [Turicibacter sp.]|nr:SAM-dependent methyltransferase [Turicibacter sp.]
HTSHLYHRYEPTPYRMLNDLFEHYQLKPTDFIVDYGCGKGRLNFYIQHYFHAHVTGIEMNQTFYENALQNKASYLKKHRRSKDSIEFHCALAEEYPIKPIENKFYFFNPFSIQIFRKIIKNILISFENYPREIELILYYASDDYQYFLENRTPFILKQEITLPNFKHDHRERFLIYQLSY